METTLNKLNILDRIIYQSIIENFKNNYPSIDNCRSITEFCDKYPELNNRSVYLEDGKDYLFRVGYKDEWIYGICIDCHNPIVKFIVLWSNVDHLKDQSSFMEDWLKIK